MNTRRLQVPALAAMAILAERHEVTMLEVERMLYSRWEQATVEAD